jgi:hypothetical protein
MKKPILLFSLFLVILSIILTASSCGGSCSKSYAIEQTTLQKLHNLLQNNNISTSESVGNTEVYIDYSDGLHPAIMSCNRVFDEVLNLVQNDATRYLVCGRSDSLKPLTRAELDSQYDPKNAKSFIEPLSILDKPLDRILKEGKQAIYITDFELTFTSSKQVNVPGGSVLSPIDLSLDWATTYFDKWLSAGHSIDVFAKPFTKTRSKGVQNQYLYFMVFTPKSTTDNRLVDGLVKLKQTEGDLQHLSFSKSRFKATPQYSNKDQQGLNENIGLRSYLSGDGFEFYQMKFEDFKRLDNVDDKKILGKLFFDQQLQGFTNLTFKAQVEDVTSGYKLLVDSTQCGTGNNLEKLNLKGTIETEYFELESKSITGGKIEFGIKKHESFTVLANDAKSQIFKISILFNSASYQPDIAKMEQVLQWKDVNLGQVVPGLYGGLKQAASRIDLKDTPVYTYYLEVEK